MGEIRDDMRVVLAMLWRLDGTTVTSLKSSGLGAGDPLIVDTDLYDTERARQEGPSG